MNQPKAKMKPEATNKNKTLSELAYTQLRHDILNGLWEPGQKLQIAKLKDHYGIGWSPLREALNRLSTLGFVERKEQQGFYVTSIDEGELLELTNTRIWLDEMALRQSFCRPTKEWEEQLLIASHRLTRCSHSRDKKDSVGSCDWKDLHSRFHSTLISNCGSAWLIHFCRQLFDQMDRYRANVHEKAVSPRALDRREDLEHQEILSACLDGDADRAVKLLAMHYKLSAELILDTELELLENPYRVAYPASDSAESPERQHGDGNDPASQGQSTKN